MSELKLIHPKMLLFRFEQGRGRKGVPRCWLVFYEGLEMSTYIRQAVQLLRASCADQSAHGRDIMPGDDKDYLIHNIDGGLIEKVEDIPWELALPGQQRAELVLTWGLPSEHLVQHIRDSE